LSKLPRIVIPTVPSGSGVGIVGILAGETPLGTAADPAGAFSWFVANAVHGI
jgi:hypothetical protein